MLILPWTILFGVVIWWASAQSFDKALLSLSKGSGRTEPDSLGFALNLDDIGQLAYFAKD